MKYFGSTSGLTALVEDQATPANGMAAYITSSYNSGHQNGDIKGAFLSDTDTTSLVGSGELVTNGTFDTDVSGWTILSDSTIAQVGGAMRVTNGPSGYATASQAITCNIGQRYKIVYSVSAPATAIATRVIIDVDELQTSPFIASPATAVTGTQTFEFVATATTHYLQMQVFSGTASVAMDFDNISVKLADADRSVNNKGLIVNGTVTRSPVATGAELVAYSGFSASNYLEQPYNSALDFGTGDFCVMGWGRSNSTNSSTQTFISMNDGTYSLRLGRTTTSGVTYVNSVFLQIIGMGGTLNAASGIQNTTFSAGVWNFVCLMRVGGITYVYFNGVLVYTSSTAYGDFVTTGTTLRIGSEFTVESYEMAMALWRISATAPTAEQIARIYNDEKVLFQENAAATLYGTSDAVTALAHDEDTGLLHVGTSAGRSVFQGLRRVSNTTTAVGTAISASNGLVAEE